MKPTQDPLKTTIKGVKSDAYVRAVVRSIQDKIFEYGVCSDAEQQYLKRYCDHFEQIGRRNVDFLNV